MPCINKLELYREIEEFKSHLKTNKEDFYDKVKHFLKEKQEMRIDLS